MIHKRPLPLTLCALSVLSWILPPAAWAAERVGTPYRGPGELTTAGSSSETGTDAPPDTGTPPDPGSGDQGSDPNAGTPTQGADTGRGKVAKIDGNILWQWYWEYNKDRYLARSTERGRIAAGSVYYWLGSGAKFPPRQIDPVSASVRADQIFAAIKKGLKDSDIGVRAEACIALGRLGTVPVAPDKREEGKPDNLVARELLRVLQDTANTANHGLVHQSALLGIGISGDETACAWVLANLDKVSPDEKPYAYIAFGLARYAPAIPALLQDLPRSARARATTDENLAALHALGLYGPAYVDEINKDDRNGVKEIEDLVDTRGDTAVVTQAIAALARLQVAERTVEKAFSSKTNEIQWTSLLSLANYSADEDMAGDAAKALMTRGFKSGKGQSKNFTILSLGELASRLDPNSKTRGSILKFLKDEGLDTKDNQIRGAAALALAMANDSTAVPAIADLLQDTTADEHVAASASLALGLLRATDYAGLIQREVLDKNVKADERGYGLLGVALMGDTTLMPEIMKIVNSRPPKETERQMTLAMGVLGEHDTVKPLINCFSSEWKTNKNFMVSNAAYGLGWMKDQSAVDDLVKLASTSPHAMVRAMAMIALGYVGSTSRVNQLSRCYENISFRNNFGGWELLVTLSDIL